MLKNVKKNKKHIVEMNIKMSFWKILKTNYFLIILTFVYCFSEVEFRNETGEELSFGLLQEDKA